MCLACFERRKGGWQGGLEDSEEENVIFDLRGHVGPLSPSSGVCWLGISFEAREFGVLDHGGAWWGVGLREDDRIKAPGS